MSGAPLLTYKLLIMPLCTSNFNAQFFCSVEHAFRAVHYPFKIPHTRLLNSFLILFVKYICEELI